MGLELRSLYLPISSLCNKPYKKHWCADYREHAYHKFIECNHLSNGHGHICISAHQKLSVAGGTKQAVMKPLSVARFVIGIGKLQKQQNGIALNRNKSRP